MTWIEFVNAHPELCAIVLVGCTWLLADAAGRWGDGK